MKKQSLPAVLLTSLMLLGSVVPAHAVYYGSAHESYRQRHPVKAYFYRHPYQKKAAIGAGIGAVGGGVLGLGVARGAIVGAGAGAGYEYLKRH